MRWEEYYSDPFEYFNQLTVKVGPWDLNVIKEHIKLREVISKGVLLTLGLWIVMGFDSGTGQLEWPIVKIIQGDYRVWYWFDWAYGKTMHWSAFVIYGLLYIMTSRALENLGIYKSKNVAYSFGVVFFNIAIFEYFWIYGFAHFQDQPWVGSWRWPQVKILIQNLAFALVGVLAMLHFWLWSYELDDQGEITDRLYRFRMNWRLPIVIALTLIGAIFWIRYPWPVDQFSLEIQGLGTWQSSLQFPQTLYTIDLDITDTVNAGDWFWFENDLLHAVNSIVKILWAMVSLEWVRAWRRT